MAENGFPTVRRKATETETKQRRCWCARIALILSWTRLMFGRTVCALHCARVRGGVVLPIRGCMRRRRTIKTMECGCTGRDECTKLQTNKQTNKRIRRRATAAVMVRTSILTFNGIGMSILINERGEVGCVLVCVVFFLFSLSSFYTLFPAHSPPTVRGATYNAHAARARTRRSLSVAHPHAPTRGTVAHSIRRRDSTARLNVNAVRLFKQQRQLRSAVRHHQNAATTIFFCSLRSPLHSPLTA